MFSTLKRALDLVGRETWRKWLLLVGLGIVVSGFEMLGAGLVYLLVSLVADPSGPVALPIVGDVREMFGDNEETALLRWLAAGLTLFFLVRAAVRVGAAYVQGRVAHSAGARLSSRLAAGYVRLPYSFHLQRNSAELIRNAHTAVQQLVGQVFLPAIRIGADTLLVVGLALILFTIAPAATALAIVVVGGASVLLLLVVQPRLKHVGRVAHSTNRETLSLLQQGLHGVRDVKLFGREAWFEAVYMRSRYRMAKALYHRNVLSEVPPALIELSLIGFILAFFSLTLASGDEPTSTLPVLGLFAYVGLRIQPSIQRIAKGLNDIKFSTAALDDVHADLVRIREVERDDDGARESMPFAHSIVLDGVVFSYEGAESSALRDINLEIRKGQQIGVCGPTGGGKSTLVDIIAGLLEPTAGTLRVDGKPADESMRSWQRNLGVVSQSVFLLDDTMQRNIALGVHADQIDELALSEAIEMAQLRPFINELPRGLNTVVGERGVRLSGGQRQRIAIARALYHRPTVLIFDEGTSALDNETEAALMVALERLRQDHTIIIVAHRLSTVENCDRVIFVENGRISGTGTYAELAASHQAFRAMARMS
ncbi:MAG: ABC transporter ATP-binding protein [Acidimicrobiia bacterium]